MDGSEFSKIRTFSSGRWELFHRFFLYIFIYRYDDVFYIAGAFIVLAGILAYVIGTLNPMDDDEEE